jgi:hypothetical protein
MPLFQFTDQTLHIIEVAIARVSIEKNGNAGGIGHKFQIVQDLGPTGFVVVSNAELSRDGEPAGPDASKPRFLHDFGAEAVVGLTNKLKLGG